MSARKKAQAFRTITEVSNWLDTPSHVLRFWESKFKQITPVKRAGGRRYYRPEDLKLIGGIKALLHDEGRTIAAVQELLKTDGPSAIEAFSQEPNFESKRRRKRAEESIEQIEQAPIEDTETTPASTAEGYSRDGLEQLEENTAAELSHGPTTETEARSLIEQSLAPTEDAQPQTAMQLSEAQNVDDIPSNESASPVSQAALLDKSELRELYNQLAIIRARIQQQLQNA